MSKGKGKKAYRADKKKYKSAVKENKQNQKQYKSTVKSETRRTNKANKAEEKKQRKNPSYKKTEYGFGVMSPRVVQTGEKPKRSDYKQSRFEKQFEKGERKGTNVYMGRGLGFTTAKEAEKFYKTTKKQDKKIKKFKESHPQKATGSSASNARMQNMVNSILLDYVEGQ